MSAVITLFRTLRTVSIRLFCKREPGVLFYNASGFVVSAYKQLTAAFFLMNVRFRYSGKNQRRFVFFFGVFLCFTVFGPTLRPPPCKHARIR